MAETLSQWLDESRMVVVAVDPRAGSLRLTADPEVGACRELSCAVGTIVVADDGAEAGLEAVNPGDTIRLEPGPGRSQRIVVLRRAWEDLTSPEV